MRRIGIFTTCLFLWTILFQGNIVAADKKNMKHYVQKYSGVTLNNKQLRNLSRYSHLIDYFTSFAYFKPRHKVNPDFIKALILAESAADPQALSHKSARGLTQIIYETGKRAAREVAAKQIHFRYVPRQKLTNLKPEDLYDPAVNILLACYLISKYNHNFDGRLELVISAWNAGENSITDDRPAQYQETLNLIGKVNGYFIYLLNEKKRYRQYTYRKG